VELALWKLVDAAYSRRENVARGLSWQGSAVVVRQKAEAMDKKDPKKDAALKVAHELEDAVAERMRAEGMARGPEKDEALKVAQEREEKAREAVGGSQAMPSMGRTSTVDSISAEIRKNNSSMQVYRKPDLEEYELPKGYQYKRDIKEPELSRVQPQHLIANWFKNCRLSVISNNSHERRECRMTGRRGLTKIAQIIGGQDDQEENGAIDKQSGHVDDELSRLCGAPCTQYGEDMA